MILEINPKLLASYSTLLPNLKSNWSISNCPILLTFTFVIAIHSCHRCVYLIVIVIFSVIACTITSSLKRTRLRRFSFYFGGLGHFAIMWSLDPHLKHLQGGHSVCLIDETSTARAFSFSFLILLKNFSAEWLLPPQNVHFVWTACDISIFLPKPELLSIFR